MLAGPTPATLSGEAFADEDDQAPDPIETITRRLVAANECRAPATRGVPSVFQLADRMPRLLWPRGVGVNRANSDDVPRFYECNREAAPGTTRCVGLQYPSNRWTPEAAEQERVRRAKQRPPKPTNRFKRKGKKLIALVGVDG